MTVSSTCAALWGRGAPCSQSRTVPSGRWNRAANSSCVKFSFLRNARTVGTGRARASCALVAGDASGSETAARWRSASLMASKACQSVFGSFFGLSLNLVIFPLFMRLRSSCGYDADNLAPHCIGDEEHSAVDQTDGIKAQLATVIEIIKLDHIRIQEHFRRRPEVDTVLLPVGLFLGAVPVEVQCGPELEYTDIQYILQGWQDDLWEGRRRRYCALAQPARQTQAVGSGRSHDPSLDLRFARNKKQPIPFNVFTRRDLCISELVIFAWA